MKKLILTLSALFSAAITVTAQDIDMKDEVLIFDEAAGTVKVGVIAKNKNANPTTVDVAVVSNFGTATSADYTLTTTKLTFPATTPDPDTQYINISITNDAASEAVEYLAVRLSNPTNGTIGDETAVVYIKDNDYKAPVARKNIALKFLGRYTMPQSGSSAEILAYDSVSNRLFVVNSEKNVIQILSFANPAAPTKIDSVDMSAYGGGINSVAVKNGVVAVAVQASPKTDSGSVVMLDTNGTLLKQVKAGFLPDMITFTPDGKYILTANEGEPNDDYSIDPEGSVTIVDMTSGAASATSSHARFTAFNAQAATLKGKGVRLFDNFNTPTVAQDLEPEYIAINKTSDTAVIALQENNAIALMHIPSGTIFAIEGLGTVDHNSAGNGIDASNRTDEVLIANWPVRGMYQPDAIAPYTANGVSYVILANEGDARDYDKPFTEEERVKDLKLDPTAFPEADLYQEDYCLGRLKTTSQHGDTDNDGDVDIIYSYGSRSFSIVNATNGNVVFNSGDQFEQITSTDPKIGKIFNSSNDDNDFKDRSDDKGPEPEAVTVGVINDTTYAFIGLERIGGVMVYDVSNPTAPVFVDYINTRDTASFGGDNGPEDLKFIHRDNKYYLVSSNEVSGTVAVFEVEFVPVSVANIESQLEKLNVYPNPTRTGELYFSQPVSGVLYNINGVVVARFTNVNSINTNSISSGIYFLQAEGFQVEKVVIQ